MHILFTRPLEDCHEMILKFQSLGHEISHLPLINIEGLKYEAPNYSEFKGIIFTSTNAIKFLDIKNIDKKLNVFVLEVLLKKKLEVLVFKMFLQLKEMLII